MFVRRVLLPVILSLSLAIQPGASQTNHVGQPPSNPRSLNQAMILGLSGIIVPTSLGIMAAGEDGALVGSVLMLSSWILGPAPGLFYAGNDTGAWDGMGVRTLTAAVALGGGALFAANFDLFGDDSDDGAITAGALIVVGAAGFTVASWIRDLQKIRPSVERYNQGLRAAPLLTADGKVGAQLTFRW